MSTTSVKWLRLVNSDAAFGGHVDERNVQAVLVVADVVLPDGTVIDDAGTRVWSPGEAPQRSRQSG